MNETSRSDAFAPLARIALRIADPHAGAPAVAIADALDAGIPAATVAEAILQGIPYSGFPGAVEALGALREVAPDFAATEPTPPNSPREEDTLPPAFIAVYRAGSESVRGALESRHPALARWILDFAYDTVMGRGILSLAELEGLAVASLIGQRRRTPLHSHLRGALRNGWSGADLAQLLDRLGDECDDETLRFAHAIIERED